MGPCFHNDGTAVERMVNADSRDTAVSIDVLLIVKFLETPKPGRHKMVEVERGWFMGIWLGVTETATSDEAVQSECNERFN